MNDREMILDADKWPNWPMLPVKRKNNSMAEGNMGCLLATLEHQNACRRKPGCNFVIYHFNMFKPPQSMKDVPKIEYPTIEAMLADGWIVD